MKILLYYFEMSEKENCIKFYRFIQNLNLNHMKKDYWPSINIFIFIEVTIC